MTLFLLIWLSYTLIAFNTRVVARGAYAATIVTDALIAIVGFVLIKHIAVSDWHQLVWYTLGAMAGGASGIWLSKKAGHQ
jgi:uncharacterized membrane protein YfcA